MKPHGRVRRTSGVRHIVKDESQRAVGARLPRVLDALQKNFVIFFSLIVIKSFKMVFTVGSDECLCMLNDYIFTFKRSFL